MQGLWKAMRWGWALVFLMSGLVPASASPETGSGQAAASLAGARILVFSRTTGFRHESIEAGKAALGALAKENGFSVTYTEDPRRFSRHGLARFAAVIFLNTTGDVLNEAQQAAFERYIRSGRALLGIHSATDTEGDGTWPWYTALIGAHFLSHPAIQEARLIAAAPDGQAFCDRHRPIDCTDLRFTDEWYDFREVSAGIRPILLIDRASYAGSTAHGLSPIVWSNLHDGGRAYYIGLGHRRETYQTPLMRTLIQEGLEFLLSDADAGQRKLSR
jgi:cytochrome c